MSDSTGWVYDPAGIDVALLKQVKEVERASLERYKELCPAAEYTPALLVHVADPQEAEGANDPWQLAQLERAWQLRAARALCEQGVRLLDPSRFDQRGSVRVGCDVEIDANVVLEGEVELGDGVRIGPFTRLKDVRLGAGTEVRAHCDLDGVVAEGAVQIGPYARLRPGTVLADGVHIGNFVEVNVSSDHGENTLNGHVWAFEE